MKKLIAVLVAVAMLAAVGYAAATMVISAPDDGDDGIALLAEDPSTTEPEASEPETSEPEASEPETSEPEASEPEASEPETSEPETSQPETSAPSTDDDDEDEEPVDNTGVKYVASARPDSSVDVEQGSTKIKGVESATISGTRPGADGEHPVTITIGGDGKVADVDLGDMTSDNVTSVITPDGNGGYTFVTDDDE